MKKTLPTEQIGSIPRRKVLIDAYKDYKIGKVSYEDLSALAEKETIMVMKELEKLGCPIISDGEQRKFDGFAHYCLHDSSSYSNKGFTVYFKDGHKRVFSPHLSKPPFKYEQTADDFLKFALKYANVPVKQAVISPSMLSLVYPPEGIENYTHEEFINDLIEQHVTEVKQCLELGAHKVQLDFTEARLSLKLDPSGELLTSFVDLINKCLTHFTEEEIQKIGIHTCPGADMDSTHSAEIDYKYLLPTLFKINAGNFYVAMSAEKDIDKALRLIGKVIKPFQKVFIGVINPSNEKLETAEEVCALIIKAAKFIPIDQLGTTDDCGFSPFADDDSTNRNLVYNKIRARIQGTKLAEIKLFGKS